MISLNFILFILASSVLIAGNEVAKRTFLLPVWFTRKTAHLGGSLIAFLAPLFLYQKEIIVVSIIFAIVLFFTRRTSFFSSIHAVKRNTLGEVFLPIGVIISALFFLPDHVQAYQYGILIMGISDGLAGLIGEGFGRHPIKIFSGRKTIEGLFVFFLTSLVLTMLFATGFGYKILMIAFILTAVEFCLEYGSDNLVLPVLGALLIQLV